MAFERKAMSHANSCSKTKKKSKKLKKTVRCTVQDCEVELGSKKMLKLHFKRMHGNLLSSYCCSICSKSINDISNYKKHLKVHRSVMGIECPICTKQVFKYNLSRHMKSFHGPIKIVSEILEGILSRLDVSCNVNQGQIILNDMHEEADINISEEGDIDIFDEADSDIFEEADHNISNAQTTSAINQDHDKQPPNLAQTTPFSNQTKTTPIVRHTQSTPFSIRTYPRVPQVTPFSNQPRTTPFLRQSKTTPFIKQTQAISMLRQAQTTPVSYQPQTTPFANQHLDTPFLRQAQTPDEEGRNLVPLQAMATGAQFVCSLCAFTTGSSYNLRRHHESLHSETRVICSRSFCEEYFQTKYMMLKHLAECYIYCSWDNCTKKFKYQKKFDSHQRFHKNIVRRYY